MRRNPIFSAIQFVVIVAVSTILGLALAMVAGAQGISPLFSTIGGLGFGLVSALVGFGFASSHKSHERISGGRVLGVRLTVCGFTLAIAGWLIGIFFSPTIGHLAVAVGVVSGCAGIAFIRFGSGAGSNVAP